MPKKRSAVGAIFNRVSKDNTVNYGEYMRWINKALAAKYKDMPLDILLNNAGIPGEYKGQVFGNFDFDTYQLVMDVNVHGPMRLAQAFISNVEASEMKKIINI